MFSHLFRVRQLNKLIMKYNTYVMRDGRIDFQKPFFNGDVVVKLYPQKGGDGFYPHIYYKGRINSTQTSILKDMRITEHYMKEPKGFTQISFGKRYELKGALLDVRALETLVGPLIDLK